MFDVRTCDTTLRRNLRVNSDEETDCLSTLVISTVRDAGRCFDFRTNANHSFKRNARAVTGKVSNRFGTRKTGKLARTYGASLYRGTCVYMSVRTAADFRVFVRRTFLFRKSTGRDGDDNLTGADDVCPEMEIAIEI